MSFTRAQVDTLLKPIKPRRVLKAQGQSHVAAFDVIAHLNRVFGFGGWSKEIVSLDLAHERTEADDKGKPRCWVTYRCVMRLTVKDPEGRVVFVTDDAATGSAQNMPSVADAHDFAAKNAVSYALKRCAKDLGDQFGLSLYNKGQESALVGTTLVMPDAGMVVPTPVDVEEHAPAPLSMGNDELQHDATPDPAPVDHVDLGTPPDAVTPDSLKARAHDVGLTYGQLMRVAQDIAKKLAIDSPAALPAVVENADLLAGVQAHLAAREGA